jgi:hypothetical protein
MTAKYLDKVAAQQRAELYYEVHPRSPSAVRGPKLCVRSETWVALLGHSLRDGIAGFGPTVEAALRAFDTQYLNSLRQSSVGEASALDRADSPPPAPITGLPLRGNNICPGRIRNVGFYALADSPLTRSVSAG